jgi:shikimate dehydrogenase
VARITGTTALYGVIGHPVDHVRSPSIFNAFLAEQGRDGVLVPLHIRPDDLATGLDGLRRLANLVGFLVTLPHKQAILPLLDDLTSTARQVGAVNIVVRTPTGRLIGDQIDGQGFVGALRGSDRVVKGARIFMAGAGGVACGIAFALAESGVSAITLHNRSWARAEDLATRLRSAFPALDVRLGAADPTGHDIVVNATSLGMNPDDEPPLPLDMLASDMMVCDVVSARRETPLIRAALARGCRVQYGEDMVTPQLALMLDRFDRLGR